MNNAASSFAALQRFLDAQEGMIEVAVAELARGRKQSHWMWFVFPQLEGLGQSDMARRWRRIRRSLSACWIGFSGGIATRKR
ncbi:MAG: DUF1810 family protein [Verrucomicrobia bacterium]|nr:DUF1810 family protein [Verrucomicrobiota bacterium]